MLGLKINHWINYFSGVVLASTLLLPDFHFSASLPAFQLLDLLLPFIILLLFVQRKSINWNVYHIFIGFFVIYILLTMAINGRLKQSRDYFEIFKFLKFGLVIILMSLTDAKHLLSLWVKPLFVILVILNLAHFFNLFNFNYIIENYYNGGLNIQYFGKNSLLQPAGKRMIGLMGNPNNNAILFLIFSVLFFPFSFEKSKTTWFAIAITMTFMCQSKTSLIALILLILTICFLKYTLWNWQKWLKFLSLIAFTYFIAWMFSSQFFKYPIYGNSMFNGVVIESQSAMGRLEAWKFLGKMIYEKPIFGYGPNKDFFYIHHIYSENEYVLYAWRYGLIGVLMYLGFYFVPIKILVFNNKTPYSKYIVLISILLMACASTNNPLSERNIFILFAVILGLTLNLSKQSLHKSQIQ